MKSHVPLKFNFELSFIPLEFNGVEVEIGYWTEGSRPHPDPDPPGHILKSKVLGACIPEIWSDFRRAITAKCEGTGC